MGLSSTIKEDSSFDVHIFSATTTAEKGAYFLAAAFAPSEVVKSFEGVIMEG